MWWWVWCDGMWCVCVCGGMCVMGVMCVCGGMCVVGVVCGWWDVCGVWWDGCGVCVVIWCVVNVVLKSTLQASTGRFYLPERPGWSTKEAKGHHPSLDSLVATTTTTTLQATQVE
ncbi:hypothetical protein M8J75_010949 [Diaphorina citri]|nr:hypothetical protein M8J75_010949 [Diaphorina citri]